MITALHVLANGRQEIFHYDPHAHDSLEILQARVGGWIEAAPIADRRLTMYCDEEGKLKRRPVNIVATELLEPSNPDVIVGDVVIVGAPDQEGYDQSLPEGYGQGT